MSVESQQQGIIDKLAADGIIVSGSTTSIRRKWTYAIAFNGDMLEKRQDIFFTDVKDYIYNMKPHSPQWYAQKGLDFQYGFNLLPDSDKFDNSGYSDAQIAASKVVKYCSVTPLVNVWGKVKLRIKIATISGDDLAPVSNSVLLAVTEYFNRIKDAGVNIVVESLPADNIKQTWRIYFDPLLIDQSGNRRDGSGNDVARAAIKGYLKKLSFNGLYVPQHHIDYVQAVPGLVITEPDSIMVKYGLLPFTNVITEYSPDAGYLRFASDADLIIQYIPHSAI